MSRNAPAEERDRLMEEAAEGRVAVIVATDNLARGIDLANLRLVINYDPPKAARTYVHRVGRTARAGRTGSSVTFLRSSWSFSQDESSGRCLLCTNPGQSRRAAAGAAAAIVVVVGRTTARANPARTPRPLFSASPEYSAAGRRSGPADCHQGGHRRVMTIL